MDWQVEACTQSSATIISLAELWSGKWLHVQLLGQLVSSPIGPNNCMEFSKSWTNIKF